MIARLMADNPTLQPSAFELQCPAGTSKIALIVDEDQDYHFGRFDAPYDNKEEDPTALQNNTNTTNNNDNPKPLKASNTAPRNRAQAANDPKAVNNSPSLTTRNSTEKGKNKGREDITNPPITWGSHKGGEQPATNRDATGHKIFDFALANFNYNRDKTDRLNYDRFCGYFCVPRDRPLFVKTGGKYPKRYKNTRKTR
jgi:hypothetical protein